MKKTKKIIGVVFACIILFVFTAIPASADAPIVLRIGCATAGTHPHNIFMEALKPALEEATDGQSPDINITSAGYHIFVRKYAENLVPFTAECITAHSRMIF